MIFHFLGNFQAADDPQARIDAEAAGIAIGVDDLFREEGGNLFGGGVGVEDEHAGLVGVEPIDALEELEDLETGRSIRDLSEIHLAVAGDEVFRVYQAEFDIERLISFSIWAVICGR